VNASPISSYLQCKIKFPLCIWNRLMYLWSHVKKYRSLYVFPAAPKPYICIAWQKFMCCNPFSKYWFMNMFKIDLNKYDVVQKNTRVTETTTHNANLVHERNTVNMCTYKSHTTRHFHMFMYVSTSKLAYMLM
jgi:hypothetical protein